ncbi:hypothetical protein [Streptomyces sp. WG7]|uniref:hypothetical protein n=1 Tax=Streptomyces sp. WG7 TaxID=3417650 RepID=UPI003CE7BDA4
MRSARMLLTTAAASAVLVLGAPGAYAAVGGDWDQDDASHSKEHDDASHKKDDEASHSKGDDDASHSKGDEDASHSEGDDDASHSKEHDKGGKYDEPRGGMHTGGGALTMVNGDWEGGSKGSDSHKQDDGEKSWGGGEHEKPRGGMHTGGGGLDAPTTTVGGLAVLAVAGTGLYAVRRRKSANGVA